MKDVARHALLQVEQDLESVLKELAQFPPTDQTVQLSPALEQLSDELVLKFTRALIIVGEHTCCPPLRCIARHVLLKSQQR